MRFCGQLKLREMLKNRGNDGQKGVTSTNTNNLGHQLG